MNELQKLGALDIEEMQAVLFDADALKEPNYTLWQLNEKGHRYYYLYDENGEPQFYPSVTTILSQTIPNPFITKWIADLGWEEAERIKNERASYGTYMHGMFEQLIVNKTYNLDMLKDDLADYIANHNLSHTFINYADELQKDILSFAQFIKDYEVKPIAVEVALVHPTRKYAGMVDLICTMKKSLKSEERITAVVDFKSGKKGFYESHEIQLHLYKDMVEVNFDIEVDAVYNFAPKDWRKAPSYHLKDQTKSVNAQKADAILAIAQVEDIKREKQFTKCGGIIDLNDYDATKYITTLTLADMVRKPNDEEEKPQDCENCDLTHDNSQDDTLCHQEGEKPLEGKNEENKPKRKRKTKKQ